MGRRPPKAPVGGRAAQQQLVLLALARHAWPVVYIESWRELLAYMKQIGYWSSRGVPFKERGLRDHIKKFGEPPPFTKRRMHGPHKPKTIYSNSHLIAAWLMTHRYPHP